VQIPVGREIEARSAVARHREFPRKRFLVASRTSVLTGVSHFVVFYDTKSYIYINDAASVVILVAVAKAAAPT
jgi:hypothetical protein